MHPAIADFTSSRFSTDQFPPERRLAKVQETLEQSLSSRRILSPFSDSPFQLNMSVHNAFMRPLPPDTAVLRLLLRYLEILQDENALRTPELRRAFAAHIHDLCALTIGATRDAAELAGGRGLRAARLRAIKADIAENLANGDVSAAALAARQAVTPRYVRKLFESEGTTLSQFVLGQRLTRAHRMLSDERYRHQAIGTIAYGVGFGDLSTFNRAFRRRFGATPSDVRAAAMAS